MSVGVCEWALADDEGRSAVPAGGAGGFQLPLWNLGAGLFGAQETPPPGGGAPVVVTPPEPPRPWGGYDPKIGGFFLQSPDGKFLLKFNARIQVRYTAFLKDSQGSDDPGHDESYAELERARLGLSGFFFDPSLEYKVEIDAESDAGDKGALTDAFINYKHSKKIMVGIGQFKPYFMRQESTSSGRQQRVDRSLSNEFFNIDRNIGGWIDGYVGSDDKSVLYWNVALTNGIDTVNQLSGGGGTQTLDQHPAYIGKIDVILAGDHRYSYEESDVKISDKPLFVVGGSFVHEKYDPGQVQSTAFISASGEVTSFGLDAIFKYQGLSVEGDYVGRWYDPAGGEALYSHGMNIQGGFFICPKEKIEITGRVSTIWGNEGPNDGNAIEVGPGINWFFAGNHNGKVQLDVAWIDISNNLPSGTENVRGGGNVAFGSTAAGFSEGEQGVLTRFQVHLGF